jgi:hypothetical protein
MGVTGVYTISVTIFEHSYNMELHIKENKFDVIASLKDGVQTRSFFNGRTNLNPMEETESHNFIFYNAQLDDYTNLPVPGKAGEYVNLTPPGGYYIGGLEFGGTVFNDVLTGAIIFKNGIIASVYGKRINGEPRVNTKFRTDGLPGVNRYCTCVVGSCTHRGYCDNCQIFNSLGATKHKGVKFRVEDCMLGQAEKILGPLERPIQRGADGKPMPKHGPHHLIEKGYSYKK